MTSLTLVRPSSRTAGFACALLGALVMMASASLPSPFYPLLQREIGFAPATMTVIFAVYALMVLAVLLTAGAVSDHLGRRPVISAGFALLAVSAVIFDRASGAGALIAARAVQGAACGLLISTLSAAIVDFEPAGRPGLAAVSNSVAPLVGLGAGSLIAGLVIDLAARPREAAFLGLAAASLALAAAVWLLPETSPRKAGLWRALRPQVGVPPEVRRVFWTGAPALFASWATGGFYLSLGAPVMERIFGIDSALGQGAVVSVLSGMGALACLMARNLAPRQVTLYGTAAMVGGTLLSLAAVAAGAVAPYFAALAVVGTGFGACFYGFLRTVAPLTTPQRRGELFSAIFTLSYLAFGVPAVLAGLAVQRFGLAATLAGYGVVVMAMAALAGLSALSSGRS